VNSLKLLYLLKSSQAELERSQSPVHKPRETEYICSLCFKPCGVYCRLCLGKLARDSLKSYQFAISDDGRITENLLPTDRHPADDLCILSVMCLVKLFFMGDNATEDSLKSVKTSHLLQAAILLEYATSRSKHNFQISLLLIRLYSYLGCGSLAMRAFWRLSVKQIQLDTLSYTLFDRISSLHPHAFGHSPDGSSEFRTPTEHFQKQQKLYRSAREQVSKNIAVAFKYDNYNSIFEIKEVSETLSKSMSAVMSVVEQRRVSRILQPEIPPTTVSSGYDVLRKSKPINYYFHEAKCAVAPNPEDLKTRYSDTYDYETFPNFESTQGPRFEVLTRFAPGPSVS
jgi:N-terminal acetyltransferase B complex non-catalytic subunit